MRHKHTLRRKSNNLNESYREDRVVSRTAKWGEQRG
jgi:hypothetical protein